MGSLRDFALPDLGEGLTESELVAWHVAVGDPVLLNQTIAEVETAKAIVQLPSPFAGTVARLYVEPGTTIAVGTPILAFDVEEDAALTVERNPVLVGYGPVVEGTDRPRRRKRIEPHPVVEPVSISGDPENFAPSSATNSATSSAAPRSTPPVRKLANDLGVDLERVRGSGTGGMIQREDVLAAASAGQVAEPAVQVLEPGRRAARSDQRELRIPIKGVRKHTAAAMVSSAFSAPHATVFLTLDVSPTMELIAALRANRAFAGVKLTLLAVVAKALCIAVRRSPALNSRWDEAAGEIVQFGYVSLGIAVATPRGLIVPTIPDADGLTLAELAAAIGELATTARAGLTSAAQLSGGTISVTNIGVFGVDAGTPILNPGEAAILAVGAVRRLPWEYRGEIALREVVTLSLSFDHRLVDGEQGARFLSDIGAILAEPGMVLTMV